VCVESPELEGLIAAALDDTIARAAFDHRGHLALATALVRRRGPAGARDELRARLRRLLARFGAPPTAYDEALTAAWVARVAEALARLDRGQRVGALAAAVIEALGDRRRVEASPPPTVTDLALRPATVDDAPAIEDIYAHYVRTSTCTFQLEPGSVDERRAWLAGRAPEHPVLVAELDGAVVGWGSLSAYRERAGYRFTVEDSVYVREGLHGRGVGRALLAALVDGARLHGRHTILAAIAGDQPASVALHARFGFVEVGRLREVGLKLDRRLESRSSSACSTTDSATGAASGKRARGRSQPSSSAALPSRSGLSSKWRSGSNSQPSLSSGSWAKASAGSCTTTPWSCSPASTGSDSITSGATSPFE